MSPTENPESVIGSLPALRKRYGFAKTVLDVAVCVFLLPLAAPIMLVVALVIRLESRGSPIFVQERIGYGGRRFRLYKFRTMKNDYAGNDARQFMKAYIRGEIYSPSDGETRLVYKPSHKAYVTKVGRFLRKTSLDELPQLFNVLKRDMGLVGPRPHVAWEVEEYRPWHRGRLDVLPGITGLAQVKGRSGITFDQMVRLDLQYVRDCTLMQDLKILWWTLLVVLNGRGAA